MSENKPEKMMAEPTAISEKSRNILKITFGWIALVLSVLITITISDVEREELSMTQESFEKLRVQTRGAADQMNLALQHAERAAVELAAKVEKTFSLRDLQKDLRSMILESPYFYGGTITFKPYGFKRKQRLFSAYYWRGSKSGDLEYMQLDEAYDYTIEGDYDWYTVPMKKGNLWGAPYWDEAGKTMMTTFSAVFYRVSPESKKREPFGVVTLDISMKALNEIIRELKLDEGGYGQLVSQDGTILVHPNNNYVSLKKTLSDLGKEFNDPSYQELSDLAMQTKSGMIYHAPDKALQEYWVIVEPIEVSGWSLQKVYAPQQLIDQTSIREKLLELSALAFLLLCTLLIVNLLFATSITPKRVWFTSIAVLLVGSSLLAGCWYLAINYSSGFEIKGQKLAQHTTVDQFVDKLIEEFESRHQEPPIVIPLGLQIATVRFLSSTELGVTGIVWLKFPKKSKVPRSFTIPNAIDLEIEELDTMVVGDYEIKRWKFNAEFLARLDYSKYPLEKSLISLPLEIDYSVRNSVLVPDLDSYSLTHEMALPGLGKGSFLPGWRFLSTFFELRSEELGTTMGGKQEVTVATLPTLYYNIGIQRRFLDAFMSNLTPLILVLIVLFVILLIDMEFLRSISIIVSTIFVSVFSHIGLRSSLEVEEIFYLERFYFLVYATIIWVLYNVIREPLRVNLKVHRYQDNLFIKALFWPVILTVLLLITILVFY